MPFSQSPSTLGNSHAIALRYLFVLEKRLKRDEKLRQQYNAVLQDYLSAGYMSRVSEAKKDFPNYYIPHHCVLKPDSPTTPIRCVFNASAKTSSGQCLNSLLFAGPKLQSDIGRLFINSRLFPVCFSADIKQMYLRIGMNPDHRKFQKILW